MAPTQRMKLRFRSRDEMHAARMTESPMFDFKHMNERRLYASVEVPTSVLEERLVPPDGAFGDLLESLGEVGPLSQEMVEDRKYALERSVVQFGAEGVAPDGTLDDVLELIRAREAWDDGRRGAGVVLAIVDTGVDGAQPEFQRARAGQWAINGDDAWTDYRGHGSMCACIAAGSNPARFTGVAPGVDLFVIKTHFYDSELATAYDALTDLARQGRRVVVSNSWGMPSGTAPAADPNSDFAPAMQDAIDAGVLVVFSAGNYHELAQGTADRCGPTSIWLHKCRADVLTVGTCDLEGRIWPYSSRGRGQYAGQAGMADKPDVVAPTPVNGEILYGSRPRVLAEGWGTSGAAPQAAALAALMLAKRPGLTRAQVFDAIRATALDLRHERTCQGAGMILCDAAVQAV